MRQLWDVADFVRGIRIRLRFGGLSRSPLRLLRVHWQGESIQCDWLARSPDAWDSDLNPQVREGNASLQALEDAMAVRGLLLSTFPEVEDAELRVFRQPPGRATELIIRGTVRRDTEPHGEVASLAMRAKLSGLQFSLEDGILKALQEDTVALSNS
jgi:hypothetical protein